MDYSLRRFQEESIERQITDFLSLENKAKSLDERKFSNKQDKENTCNVKNTRR